MIIIKSDITKHVYQALDLLHLSYWRIQRKLKDNPEDMLLADEFLQISLAVEKSKELLKQIELIQSDWIE
tara:strand:+ start:1469 stop:1678 length:210 start_codon:yes stop_codon:yes gene_type:complete